MEQYSNYPSDPFFMSNLLKAEEVAERLNICKSFAYSLMKTGQLSTVQIGRSVRVRPQDLEDYINQNTTGGFGLN